MKEGGWRACGVSKVQHNKEEGARSRPGYYWRGSAVGVCAGVFLWSGYKKKSDKCFLSDLW